ncbi:6,7-dimethyl-8-ribityllumazine synthase [Parvularcula sp. ZS-1/3]|uniref:6,7-dimethyl-8-ribityllumazine synthase n=1 Tax=Parvularcula mediterranea TaxID=2732508 RepID=A0A7Y3RL18_9PROT|nr:6,7-dimethyl-8-ribityllumazine synthase [Parvularcula mediterranea]NNU16049.1 6,7-dimethyl-8-ribityllumazine synthase [Parvularcula mediterranea]
MNRIEGSADGSKLRVCVIDTQWNDFIVSRLTEGALATLKKHGVADEAITHVTVPGAFEVPITAKAAAETGHYDAIVCLGCVIRGATAHFDYVAGEAAKGIAKVGLDTGVPTVFGILTTETVEQAMDRAGIKLGNKGAEAATVAVETANTLIAIKKG